MTARQRMDVERLVTWALRDQGLGWAGFGDGGLSFADLGTRVDRSVVGAPTPALQSDDDALVVHRTIGALPPEAADLVIRYCRIGDRPDWCEEGEGDYVQRVGKNGRPAWFYEKPGDRRSKKYPVMEWQGWRPEQVRYWRATYTLWWQSLVDMVDPLNRELDHHEAVLPAAPEKPWVAGRATLYAQDGSPLPVRAKAELDRDIRQGFVEIEGALYKLDD